MISLALPRMQAGRSLASAAEVVVRYVVAPAPTGSSTHGMPRAPAVRTAFSIAVTQAGESVPIFTTSAAEIATNSSTSSLAWIMAGEAPSASRAFAVLFITT